MPETVSAMYSFTEKSYTIDGLTGQYACRFFNRKHNNPVWLCIAALVCVMLFSGCLGPSEKEKLITGYWRLNYGNNKHTILYIKGIKKFSVEVQVEGKNKEIQKKVGKATGDWIFSEQDMLLTLNTTIQDVEIGWMEGSMVYEILNLDENNLTLRDESGNVDEWKRVTAPKEEEMEEKIESLSIAPIVVNTARGMYSEKYRWICADIELVLDSYGIVYENPLAEKLVPLIHPIIKEKISFYLSSKPYMDINTQDKLKATQAELQAILNPYMDGKILRVTYNVFMITGNANAVDEFVDGYRPKRQEPAEGEAPPPEEGSADTAEKPKEKSK